MAQESARVDLWIAATLKADAELRDLVDGRVYDTLAAQGDQHLPCVVFSYQSGLDKLTLARRSASVLRYQIKALGKGGSFVDLMAVADRIDALFSPPRFDRVVTDQAQIISAQRVETVKFAEVDAGVRYNHLGGLYEIGTQPIPPPID